MKPIIAYVVLSVVVLMLFGCSTTQPLPERVLVPVPVECEAPALPPRPELPISSLPEKAPASDVARAYAATVEVLIGYAKQLEALLTPNSSKPSTSSR